MISAARLRKAQERALAARPYGKMLREMLANVAAAAGQSRRGRASSLRPKKKILVVVVTADRGGWRLQHQSFETGPAVRQRA